MRIRELNPRQWSLAKQSSLKIEKFCKKCKYKVQPKGVV